MLLLAVVSIQVPGKDGVRKVVFESMGQSRTFHLFVPEDVQGEKVPLLLTFHGSGGGGASLVEKWKGLARTENLIVAGLDSLEPST